MQLDLKKNRKMFKKTNARCFKKQMKVKRTFAVYAYIIHRNVFSEIM